MSLIQTGSDAIVIKSPSRKIMGNLKKLEKVCASKTSLAETAMESPRRVEKIDRRSIL